ncbi:unnamed protein product, partial [Prorocentrum cordatum]
SGAGLRATRPRPAAGRPTGRRPMPPPGAAGPRLGAKLPIEDDIRDTVGEAASGKLRALKVVVDSRRPRLVLRETVAEHGSFVEDFGAICALLEATVPCIVLVRLQGVDSIAPAPGDRDWVLMAWTPE